MRLKLRSWTVPGLACLISVLIWLVFHFSYELGHWWKLLNPPDSLYDPTILEHEVNLSRGSVLDYDLLYDYYDYYDVGVLLPPSALPSSMNKEKKPYTFAGRLKISLLSRNGKILREKVVHKPLRKKF